MRRLRFVRRIGEQASSLLRNIPGFSRFWNRSVALPTEQVDFNLARELYKNSNQDYSLGAGFCRPIIDSAVEFIGLPRATSDNPTRDDFLNECIHTYWADAIQQMVRDCTRDSKVVVRMSLPNYLSNPLFAAEEIGRARMEVLPPERVRVYYNPVQGDQVDMAIIEYAIPMLDEEPDLIQPWNDPTETIHSIFEVITPDRYDYWDQTASEWIEEWGHQNDFRFVPVIEGYNEWDAASQRGQSDLEAVFPFIKAFHDVMVQSLQAHAYHSIPKVKFKINEISTFLRNNFPDSFGEDGQFSGSVNWQGKEILFLQGGTEGEDASFLEAQSILGDSKTLLEFIFDCICISSETPGWAFMRESSGQIQSKPADALRFVKRIGRKRKTFEGILDLVCRMALVIDGQRPARVKFAWETVRPEDEAAKQQALQQMVMALEVAAQRKIISDDTYRAAMRVFLPFMKNPNQEEADAEDNFNINEIAATNGNVPLTTTAGAGGQNE